VKYLIPAPIGAKQRIASSIEFTEDVARLVAVAAAAGYTLTSAHAASIWKRYSDALCASWLVLPPDDADVLRDLLEHGVVKDAPTPMPPPPAGYGSWLDYAITTMDVRSLVLSELFADEPQSYTREAYRDAARAELAALRRAAGE